MLERRLKTNPSEASAIVVDLEQHGLLENLVNLTPRLSGEVLTALLKVTSFRNLLTQPTSENGPLRIHAVPASVLGCLLVSLPPEQVHDLVRATPVRQLVEALSQQFESFDAIVAWMVPCKLPLDIEDAIINACGAAEQQEPTPGGHQPPVASTLNAPTTTPLEPVAAPLGPVQATSTVSPSQHDQDTALAAAAAAVRSPSNTTSTLPTTHQTHVALLNPVPPVIRNTPARAAAAADKPSRNVPVIPPPARQTTQPVPIQSDCPDATAGFSIFATAAADQSSGNPTGAIPTTHQTTPTAPATRDHLAAPDGEGRPAKGLPTSKQRKPRSQKPDPPPTRRIESSSLSDDDDEWYTEPKSGAEPRPKGGSSKVKQGATRAAAAPAKPTRNRPSKRKYPSPDLESSENNSEADDQPPTDIEFDPDAKIYGKVDIPTPSEHYKKWKDRMSLDVWEDIASFCLQYKDQDSHSELWDAKRAKLVPALPSVVDLPPVPRLEAEKARRKQWGDRYDEILKHEKEQFRRAPALLKEACGDFNNSMRHTADIHIRRFWAPYMHVNMCISAKTDLERANEDLVTYTFRRFKHLSIPKDSAVNAGRYCRTMKSFFNTAKKRVKTHLEHGPSEPKVSKAYLNRAISFMSGELRRAAAPALWYKETGNAEVKEQVDLRLAEFASLHSLPIDDGKVMEQRLGFQSSETARLFRLQDDNVKAQYQQKAEDPTMDPTAFADSSGPVVRSFLDAITDEVGGVALCAYAVNTSNGPITIFSQHGGYLRDRGWLQTQGTEFLQPFVKVASETFQVELGQLPLVTAAAAAPGEAVDHPWTSSSTEALALPAFKWPIEGHLLFNQGMLRSSLLRAIRVYSGQSPTMEAVVNKVEDWIVPGTMPAVCQLLVDPANMPLPMVKAWADHWRASVEDHSSLPLEARLRFRGQTMYSSPLPLPSEHNDERNENEGQGNERLRQGRVDIKGKGKAKPPAIKARRVKPKRPVTSPESSDGDDGDDDEPLIPAPPRTSARLTKKPRIAVTAAAATAGPATSPISPQRRRPSGLNVEVYIPSSPADFTKRAGNSKALPSDPNAAPTGPHSAAESFGVATPGADSDAAAPLVGNAAAVPSSQVQLQLPSDRLSKDLEDYNSQDDADMSISQAEDGPEHEAPAAATAVTPLLPQIIAANEPHAVPLAALRYQSEPLPSFTGVALVAYLSEPESPAKADILPQQPSPSATITLSIAPPLPPPSFGLATSSDTPAGSTNAGMNSALSLGQAPSPAAAAAAPHPVDGSHPVEVTVPTQALPHDGLAEFAASSSIVEAGMAEQPDEPTKPKKRARPRSRKAPEQATPEERPSRAVPVTMKEMVAYSFMDGQQSKEVRNRVRAWEESNPWKIKSLSEFMQIAAKATLGAMEHSNPVLSGLAHLTQASAVVTWYSVAESPEISGTSREYRFELPLPWTNVAEGSPPHHLFELILNPTKPLPLLSSLLSHDGGWSLADVSQFMKGLLAAVQLAFNRVASAPIGLLAHSWVDLLPVARAMAFLRSSRFLHHGPADYDGPAAAAVNLWTDRTIIFANAMAMQRYLLYNIVDSVYHSRHAEHGPPSHQYEVLKAYLGCLLTINESVATAAAQGRPDFFHFTLPNILPTTIAPVAQTVMRHQGWWYRFRDGKNVGPKPLEIETKNNLLANHLPDWCDTLTADQWGHLSGQDQTVIGILLTIALLQEMGPDGPNRLAQLKTCQVMFLRVQVAVHRSITAPQPDSEPGLPRRDGVALTDLDSNHPWAATADLPAFTTVDIETDSEGPVPPMSKRFDQNSAVKALEAHDDGKPLPRSPKKTSTAVTLRLPSVSAHASPSTSRGAAPAPSPPQHPRAGTIQSDMPDVHGLHTIPEDEETTGSADSVHERPEGAVGDSNEEGPAKKRKRSKRGVVPAAKRSRLDPVSEIAGDAAAPPGPARVTRSGSRTPVQNA
ncbi:hypothetical protein FRC00_007904 [Tulasnella sp. 408]|nr:hypothetical protein FRC00_007904 [Tulasnella sp. 408]